MKMIIKALCVILLSLFAIVVLAGQLVIFFNHLKIVVTKHGYLVQPTLTVLDQALLLLIAIIVVMTILLAIDVIN
jgi:hypothetical protein